MSALIVACIAFMAIHAVPATEARPMLVERIGLPAYLGLFSLASLVFLALAVVAYQDAPRYFTLWYASTSLRVVIALAMIVPFWLAVAGILERNPAAVGGDAVLADNAAPRGVYTITRHPLMVAVALWAGLHLIANPDLPSLVFFGTMLATALFGIRLQDRRKVHEIGTAWRRYMGQTSRMPFAAIIEGRTRLDLDGMRWWRTVLALLLWAVVLHLHADLIGVQAISY